MTIRYENPPLREDLIRDLRKKAQRGAKVRELANEIHTRLDCNEPSVILTLAYFGRAFCLPLPKILPLREWLGTEDDEAINALILPEIENAKAKWSQAEEHAVGMTE